MLSYGNVATITESDNMTIVELTWYWKRFIKQKQDEQPTPVLNGNDSGEITPRFEFLRRGT